MGTGDNSTALDQAIREQLGRLSQHDLNRIMDAIKSPSAGFYECLPQLVASSVRIELMLARQIEQQDETNALLRQLAEQAETNALSRQLEQQDKTNALLRQLAEQGTKPIKPTTRRRSAKSKAAGGEG